MCSATILIVDDETPIREMIRTSLEISNFKCIEAENSQSAHSIIVDQSPDLVLLDWMLPDFSGVELINRLRNNEITANIPIIMLTAKGEQSNKIQGLDCGADDYITKPFSPKELISRINALLRRSYTKTQTSQLEANGLLLDPVSHRVSIEGSPLNVGPTEYRLLKFFLSHPERAYTRSQLLDHVWGSNIYVEERTVDVHIRRLRKVISGKGHERYIQTVRGTGYRFSTKGL